MRAFLLILLFLFIALLIAAPHERPGADKESEGGRGNKNLND